MRTNLFSGPVSLSWLWLDHTVACVLHDDCDIAVIYMKLTETEELVAWYFPRPFPDNVT